MKRERAGALHVSSLLIKSKQLHGHLVSDNRVVLEEIRDDDVYYY